MIFTISFGNPGPSVWRPLREGVRFTSMILDSKFSRFAAVCLIGTSLQVICPCNADAKKKPSGAVQGGPLPQLFPSDNWWNLDVSSAPLDAQSTATIDWINNGGNRRLHPDFGGDSGEQAPNGLIYGMTYCTVPGTHPLSQVTFDYDDESDHGAPGQPLGYPIPKEARKQTRWIEGGIKGGGSDGDRHMLIVDRDNNRLYELYALQFKKKKWRAGSGAIYDLTTNDRRPDGWTSADAAGLAILPGLVRYDEANSTQPIRHAFRMTTRSTNGYVFPASHEAGDTAGAPPMGARFRLKDGVDISSYPDQVRRIFQAFKTYGLIVADNGSDFYISGAYDVRWDNDILNPAFGDLHASDFEMIELGWNPPI